MAGVAKPRGSGFCSAVANNLLGPINYIPDILQLFTIGHFPFQVVFTCRSSSVDFQSFETFGILYFNVTSNAGSLY